MPRQCLVVRVFTRDGGGGNHLGIVTDLAGLDTATMQQIATDLGFSETIFIAEPAAGVAPTRIFTPAMELPFAGHPLVGAAWHMMETHPGRVTHLRCGIGEVGLRREGDAVWVDVAMDPGNARPDGSGFAARVGIADPQQAWRVLTPLDYRMVQVGTFEDVARVQPATAAFGPAHGLTVFARDGDHVRMRFFIPVAGVDEDPATGSAAVALATMLAAGGEPSGHLTIDQGEEIGHPSRINLRWSGRRASIGGTVVADEMRELPQ
jgi:trans-2,3-dihydro-3-hydroxyanthranilate isomerase